MSINPIPRLLFFGTGGIFSRLVLERLLAQGHKMAAIIVAGQFLEDWRLLAPPPPLQTELLLVPSFVGNSIVEVGWREGIPVYEVSRLADSALMMIKELQPTAILVACWPTRLPNALLKLPQWGCLNVHPSLLPAFRGPVPLFWQRRAGLREGGVTIHLMSPQLDKGHILAQAPLPLPDGASGQELDAHAAQVGGQQLGHVLDTLYSGTATPYPQPAGGSYQSWPTQKDFIVPTSWRALHAWNFMQAAAEWHTPFTIQPLGQKQPLTVERALEFSPSASLNAPLLYQEDSIAVQFTPGIVWVS